MDMLQEKMLYLFGESAHQGYFPLPSLMLTPPPPPAAIQFGSQQICLISTWKLS